MWVGPVTQKHMCGTCPHCRVPRQPCGPKCDSPKTNKIRAVTILIVFHAGSAWDCAVAPRSTSVSIGMHVSNWDFPTSPENGFFCACPHVIMSVSCKSVCAVVCVSGSPRFRASRLLLYVLLSVSLRVHVWVCVCACVSVCVLVL